MKNKMTDLNNHLFLQLEKLLDPDLSDDELKKEIARAGAVSSIAANIIQNANTPSNSPNTNSNSLSGYGALTAK